MNKPGVAATGMWDDKLYQPGGQGRVTTTPRQVEGTRLIRVSESFNPLVDLRSSRGERIEMTWGQPDEDGVYDPTFTAIDDGYVMVDSQMLADSLPRALYKQEDTYVKAMQNGVLPQWWRDIAVACLAVIRKRP